MPISAIIIECPPWKMSSLTPFSEIPAMLTLQAKFLPVYIWVEIVSLWWQKNPPHTLMVVESQWHQSSQNSCLLPLSNININVVLTNAITSLSACGNKARIMCLEIDLFKYFICKNVLFIFIIILSN